MQMLSDHSSQIGKSYEHRVILDTDFDELTGNIVNLINEKIEKIAETAEVYFDNSGVFGEYVNPDFVSVDQQSILKHQIK